MSSSVLDFWGQPISGDLAIQLLLGFLTAVLVYLLRFGKIPLEFQRGHENQKAFRRGVPDADGQRPRPLSLTGSGREGAGHVAALADVTAELRGLTSKGCEENISQLCRTAARLLQAHDTTVEATSQAAAGLLQLARERRDLIGDAQLDTLELAYQSSVRLQELMNMSAEDYPEELETSCFEGTAGKPRCNVGSEGVLEPFEPSQAGDSFCGAFSQLDASGTDAADALDMAIESQRLDDLDLLMEELERQELSD
mmetsp:Transcript_40026/g.87396  ORF Transcript_40026/g.87396 Transcript_40026/m.87396 type:complete len:254 (-) Transcript_40026:397-1158(-)